MLLQLEELSAVVLVGRTVAPPAKKRLPISYLFSYYKWRMAHHAVYLTCLFVAVSACFIIIFYGMKFDLPLTHCWGLACVVVRSPPINVRNSSRATTARALDNATHFHSPLTSEACVYVIHNVIHSRSLNTITRLRMVKLAFY